MRYAKVRNAALLLGAGLGAFAEAVFVPVDAWIEVLAWLAVFGGVLALWRSIRGPGRLPHTRTLLGYLLIGWGAFAFAEGLIAHHLLDSHHAGEYDVLYLIGGGFVLLLGLAIRDRDDRVSAPPGERRTGGDRRLAL